MIFRSSKIAVVVCIASFASAGLFRLPVTRTTLRWDIRFLTAGRTIRETKI